MSGPLALTGRTVTGRFNPALTLLGGHDAEKPVAWQPLPAGQWDLEYKALTDDKSGEAPRLRGSKPVHTTLCVWPNKERPSQAVVHGNNQVTVTRDGADVSSTLKPRRLWRWWKADLDPTNPEVRLGDYEIQHHPGFGLDTESELGSEEAPVWIDAPGSHIASRPAHFQRLIIEFVVGVQNHAEPGCLYYIVIVDETPTRYRVRLSRHLNLDDNSWKFRNSANGRARYANDTEPGMNEQTGADPQTGQFPFDSGWKDYTAVVSKIRGDTLTVFEAGAVEDSQAFVKEMEKLGVSNATPPQNQNFKGFPTPLAQWASFDSAAPPGWWWDRLIQETPVWFFLSGHMLGGEFGNGNGTWTAEFGTPTNANNPFWKAFKSSRRYGLDLMCQVVIVTGCAAITSPTTSKETKNIQEVFSKFGRRPEVLGFHGLAPVGSESKQLIEFFVKELAKDWDKRYEEPHLAASWLAAGKQWTNSHNKNLGYMNENSQAFKVNVTGGVWTWDPIP
jgi:hypothetical protein